MCGGRRRPALGGTESFFAKRVGWSNAHARTHAHTCTLGQVEKARKEAEMAKLEELEKVLRL